ncbi:MAG: type II toxin-antitoxin system CcdA family antitoxin [Candidatus Dormibacteria bacterium]
MARVNVYLPEELATSIQPLDLNLSHVLQGALRELTEAQRVDWWLERVLPMGRGTASHAVTRELLARPEPG